MKEIYLDNAAATLCDEKVLEAMRPYWAGSYGNPSSFNDSGRKAREAIEESRKKIALILGAKKQEIIFTSSATESNNLAILGIAKSLQKNISKPHIITTKAEHHSVIKPINELEKNGFNVSYLNVGKDGLIDLNELKKIIRPETVLISIIYANNEIGSIQPIKKIAKIIKEIRKGPEYPHFHSDAAQAAAFLDINVNNLGVDLLTISSSKIYGPKGIAALYVKNGIKISPLFYGGGQESGIRPASEATPLIIGFAKALEITLKDQKLNNKCQNELREYFINNLKTLIPAIKINGPENPQYRVPHIINATFPEIENEQLLLQLDKHGIRASAGSACASKEIEPSHVLTAIGLSKKEARSSIRFSLGRKTTEADLGHVLKILPKMVKKIKELYPENLKKYYYTR